MRAYPRERFSSEVSLTPEMVIAFANAAGDNNPIHHDPEFAATTRFGKPTASGPHAAALLLALTAAHYSRNGAMLGLEFWVRFRRPIYAEETITLEWLVVKVTPNEKLRGEIVELRGRIKGQDGTTCLGGERSRARYRPFIDANRIHLDSWIDPPALLRHRAKGEETSTSRLIPA